MLATMTEAPCVGRAPHKFLKFRAIRNPQASIDREIPAIGPGNRKFLLATNSTPNARNNPISQKTNSV
jgi:hypothetical protein